MKLAFLGDIAFLGSFDINRNPFVLDGLKPVAKYLAGFDHVIGNFEAPFSVKKRIWGAKSAYLYADPGNVKLLKELHVDIVNLANNHMFDYGKEGYELTKEILELNGIRWFGAEGKIVKLSEMGNDLLFDGYCCYSTNPQGVVNYGKYGINELDVEIVSQKMEYYRAIGKLPIVSIHAGLEHVTTPSLESIKMARKWSEIGDYIYYGHHPHVLQGVEMYKGSLIAHSLGNFIFDDNESVSLSNLNRSSAILEVEIVGNRIINYQMTSIYLAKGEIIIKKEECSPFEDQSTVFEAALSNPEYYTQRRKEKRAEWVKERKKRRDLLWVLRRLTPRYAYLWYTNCRNEKKYRSHVESKTE